MEAEFSIRKAAIDDAPAIAKVNYSTWLHTYLGLIQDSELDSLNLDSLTDQWRQNLEGESPRASTFVVINGESLVAYSRFYPSVDPEDDQNRVATIGSMYVSPEFQKRGIGRALMHTVLQAVKNNGFMEATLHVLTDNERARKFYEGLGWQMDLGAEIGGSTYQSAPKMRYRKILS